MPSRPTNHEPAVSVVVPCFNEEGAIGRAIDDLIEHMDGEIPWELILVDDGSTDGGPGLLAEAAQRDERLRVVTHERNLGYGAAIKTGLREARAPLVAITDADGTYPADRMAELVAMAADADMVVGARTAEDVRDPVARRLPKLILRQYSSWLVGRTIPDLNSGMRVFRKPVAERFMKILPDTFSFTTTLTLAMMRNRYLVRFVPVNYASRVGRSKLKPVRDTLRFIQLIVRCGMYFAPLRFLAPVVVVLGLAFLASLAYDVFVLANLTDKTVILLLFAMNTALFALLADMIDKRSPQ